MIPTPLAITPKPLISLPTSTPGAPEFFKAALSVVVAEDRALDDPRDLTEQTTAQTGFYTHRGLDSRTFGNRPPP